MKIYVKRTDTQLWYQVLEFNDKEQSVMVEFGKGELSRWIFPLDDVEDIKIGATHATE